MAREINMDTLHQNFWAESIRKEASLRLAWSRKHQNAPGIMSMSGEGEGTSNKILERHAAKLRSFVPKPVEREQEAVKLPSINKEPSKEDIEETKSHPVAEMMLPVEKDVKQRLYYGITREGLGRCDYLKKRLEKSPDNKYSFQQCSSWDHGWDMPKEDPKTFTAPKHGRTRIVRDTFYKRYGIFYDPNEV